MNPATSENIYAIILAAGNSSRFGAPKQLCRLRDKTLLQQTVDLVRPVFQERVIVVLGADVHVIRPTLREGIVRIVENTDWQQGMSSSIKSGLGALPSSCAAALILLCDQPLLNQDSIALLLNTWLENPGQIVAGSYRDTAGVPAIFPARYFPALMTLSGDKGAKQLLMQQPDLVITVSMPEAELDIDTPDDFEKLNSLKYGSGS